MSKNIIIGIDLGTTNSCVAFMDGSEPKVIENLEGNRTMPSIYAKTKTGEKLVGITAKRQMVINPSGTIYGAKRLIGMEYKKSNIKEYIASVGYKCKEDEKGGISILIDGKEISPIQVSAFILQKIKEYAENRLNVKIKEAVITVPAYFNDAQRQATKDAGKIAGLDVKRIINEPTAAAFAYGFDKKDSQTIAIYDLGGGTFDVSVLEISGGVVEVIATNGNTHLGGEDFDMRIQKYLIDEFNKENSIDISKDIHAVQRIREAAEKAKIELSSAMSTEVSLPFILNDPNSGPKHMSIKITRSKFESLVADLIKKTIEPCKKVLLDADKSTKDIGEVILVGGMTRMPKVIEIVKDFFGKEPNKSVNPDEVVAAGAAIQGGVLSGDVKDVLLLDVTSLSLGIETLGGIFTRLIDRNTTIPVKKSQVFSTAADNQSSVTIKVFQGERDLAKNNKILGQFDLVGIPPARKGIPQIEVVFDIDANGIVHVSAVDKGSGKQQTVKIQSGGGMSKSDIEKMIKDAEKHSDEDKKQRELVELHNNVDSSVYAAEHALSEYGDKIDSDSKKKIEQTIEDLKTEVKKTDFDNEFLQNKINELTELTMKIGEKIYSNTGDAGTENQSSGDSAEGNDNDKKDDDTIIDTDYKDVN